ncbi:MAG TPA: hypothetical protein VGK22_17505 [Candidatus Angelobacter sp.]|jgi:hypothetical protein
MIYDTSYSEKLTARFEQSTAKINRAKFHITNIETVLRDWTRADDFHIVTIQHDYRKQLAYLRFTFNELTFPATELALVIGDTFHNLKSSLDILWHVVMRECHGEPSDYTKFPVENDRDKLAVPLAAAVKKKQITQTVMEFMLDTVKPYKTGNYAIWALHKLNIQDKHQLLIPILSILKFDDVYLENEMGTRLLENQFFLMDQSSSIRIDRLSVLNPLNQKIIVKDKGHATATVIFDLGIPFQGEAVVKSLKIMTEAVSGLVQAFDLLL